ncbi:acetyltransferase [Agreia bicolorata]|uniref:Acetyltransferase n=1 Tax=Agreia bicolorata TaxID=110935 RepID=A0ABR5CBZ5_9MICO|nr:acetyltransferase [Agreia bicolorata]
MSPVPHDTSVEVRPYEDGDASSTLEVFLTAITETASADYTSEQIQAWADPGGRDLRRWAEAMAGRQSFVAIIGGQLAGFSDVSEDGYIDMMFVSPQFLRRGVARTLLVYGQELARKWKASELSADVSITARPFFESQGFAIVAEQSPVKRGVMLTNFKMRKPLDHPPECVDAR